MTKLPLINPEEEENQITAFITQVFKDNIKTTAIVAVSGGIDSATSLTLAAKALKPENVLALHLPSRTTRPQSTEHANLAMDAAQIPPANRLTINISAIIQKSWRIIHFFSNAENVRAGSTKRASAAKPRPRPSGEPEVRARESVDPNEFGINRLRLANLSARIRMTLLFDQAKKHDALVVGTENLSEHLLGYYTRFGDEASDIEPIRHLYKTQVIELAKHLGIPDFIIKKPPSADLWSGQNDAGELGFTYAEADPILYLISHTLPLPDSPLAQAVLNKVNINSFKHQVPYNLN